MVLSHRLNNHSYGQMLVEVLLALAITAIMMPALLLSFVASRQGKVQQNQRLDATMLATEAKTAVRTVSELGWSFISTNGTYHPALINNTWSLASGTESVNGFSRYITIEDVYRDANGNIVSFGGILDPSTKKVTVTVSWNSFIPSSVQSTYFVGRTDNTALIQSSYDDFNVGIKTNVQVTNLQGGEVKISTNTKGQWCKPQLSSATIDLPGTPNAVTAVEGHIYVSTGAQAVSSQDSFAHILVANTDPPTFSLAGKIKGYKTNDVFGESSWAYVATSNDTKEGVIINLNTFDDQPNKIYHQEGYLNTTTDGGNSDSTDANTVFVLGNRAYLTAGNYLYIFDITTRSGTHTKIGKRIQFANSGDTAGGIYVKNLSGSIYAFIAIQGSTVEELKIAEVTNSNDNNHWKIVGSINIEPNNCSTLESGKAIFVNPAGTRVYISSTNDANFKEFFVIKTENKTAPELAGGIATNPPCTNGGGYESNGMDPEQSVVVSLQENRVILVGLNGEEYQVLDMTNENNPSRCGGMQYNTGLYGVAAVRESDGDAYAYIITGDNPRKLKVVQGGPDGPYLEAGTYESSVFDIGSSATFNRFDANADLPDPAKTKIQYQVAIADPGVSGQCSDATYVFIGPDGTSNTKFATSSALPLNNDGAGYENPGRCLKYRAYLLTTDYNVTPTLTDILFNFSP